MHERQRSKGEKQIAQRFRTFYCAIMPNCKRWKSKPNEHTPKSMSKINDLWLHFQRSWLPYRQTRAFSPIFQIVSFFLLLPIFWSMPVPEAKRIQLTFIFHLITVDKNICIDYTIKRHARNSRITDKKKIHWTFDLLRISVYVGLINASDTLPIWIHI